jgi:hypothetical protein
MSIVFRLAPMSPSIARMSAALYILPAAFLIAAVAGRDYRLAIPGTVVTLIYAWIWLWFRPTRFELSPAGMEVVWPTRRERIARQAITTAQRIDPNVLRERTGLAMRVGAGGLWGAFGWLWTRKRGIVRMYISRLDGFVWVETTGRPWLITPDDPDAFLASLGVEPTER